jgi:hypothetical protein
MSNRDITPSDVAKASNFSLCQLKDKLLISTLCNLLKMDFSLALISQIISIPSSPTDPKCEKMLMLHEHNPHLLCLC